MTSAAEAERRADRLRRDLAVTLEQIADNLAPSRLASEAVSAARQSTPAWLKRYWAFAQSPTGLAIIGGVAALGLVGGVAGGVAAGKSRPARWRQRPRMSRPLAAWAMMGRRRGARAGRKAAT